MSEIFTEDEIITVNDKHRKKYKNIYKNFFGVDVEEPSLVIKVPQNILQEILDGLKTKLSNLLIQPRQPRQPP
mgnify:CR=1 FL=1